MAEPKTMIFLRGVAEEQFNDRIVVVESGGILGRSSSSNVMTSSCGQRFDID
jgi:hypothetical protein